MEWNNNIAGNSCNQLIRQPNFVSHQTSFNFLYNYNHHFSGTEMKQSTMTGTQAETEDVGMMMEDNGNTKNGNGNGEMRKKRMTSEQLEYLENRFQEEIKLDPDRKIKLSQELGLQPRQVAVWFQNRRARWKTKQLEHLYLSLKHQLDLVSREKHKLQEEVVALRAIVQEEAIRRKQVWGGSYNSSSNNIDISGGGEDTVESTSALVNPQPQLQTPVKNTGESDNYVVFSDYNINSSTSNSTYYNLAGAAPASAHLVMPSNYP